MNRQVQGTNAPSLFRNRFLQTILLSSVLLQIGIWVRNFAILLYVAETTNNDPYAISLISVAEFAPIFVFSFIGGTFADRWRPKRTMIWCDVLSAVSVFAVLLTIHYGSWHSVYLVAFISAILSQFSQPSSMRLFKYHVAEEQLQQGMALFQSLMAILWCLARCLAPSYTARLAWKYPSLLWASFSCYPHSFLFGCPRIRYRHKQLGLKGSSEKNSSKGFVTFGKVRCSECSGWRLYLRVSPLA